MGLASHSKVGVLWTAVAAAALLGAASAQASVPAEPASADGLAVAAADPPLAPDRADRVAVMASVPVAPDRADAALVGAAVPLAADRADGAGPRSSVPLAPDRVAPAPVAADTLVPVAASSPAGDGIDWRSVLGGALALAAAMTIVTLLALAVRTRRHPGSTPVGQ